jgi:hypothetical protein
MERFMTTDRAMIGRRTAIGGALVALSPLAFPGRAMAQEKAEPCDLLVLLLKGLYQPVVHGPDLGRGCPEFRRTSVAAPVIIRPLSGPHSGVRY